MSNRRGFPRSRSVDLALAAAASLGITLGPPRGEGSGLDFEAQDRVIAQAVAGGIGPTAIASLRVYLGRCGPEAVCWPGYETTAGDTRRAKSTEIATVHQLEAIGVLVKVSRYRRECRPDGGPRSNVYLFPAARPAIVERSNVEHEDERPPAKRVPPAAARARATPAAAPAPSPEVAPEAEALEDLPLEVRAIVEALEQLAGAARPVFVDACPERARTLIKLAAEAVDKNGKPEPRSPAQVRLSVREVRDEILGGVKLDANAIASRCVRYCKAQRRQAPPIRAARTVLAAPAPAAPLEAPPPALGRSSGALLAQLTNPAPAPRRPQYRPAPRGSDLPTLDAAPTGAPTSDAPAEPPDIEAPA